MNKVIYARRDMRTKYGILYTDNKIPKWTIAKIIYDGLFKKDKLKWIKIEK